MKHKSNYSDFLRHENDLTRLKIQAECGFMLEESEALNPAIENIWLNQILDFERSIAESQKITVGELLENPAFKHVNILTDDEITEELKNLMEALRNKNIVIDSVDGIDDREMYRFITEELFHHETESSFPKNMLMCYIYEEFHPNDANDIKRHADEFIASLTNKESNYFPTFIHSIDDEEKGIAIEKLMRKLNLFRDAFDEIKLDLYQPGALIIGEEKASLDFNFALSLLPPHGSKFQSIEGKGKFQLEKEYGFWEIREIEMPGVF